MRHSRAVVVIRMGFTVISKTTGAFGNFVGTKSVGTVFNCTINLASQLQDQSFYFS